MGSVIEINDTLAITREQGFPEVLDIGEHLKNPFRAEGFEHKIFEFRNKKGIRVYKIPPVRNFLVENREGKWIYWGLVHVLQVHHDYEGSITSGKFKILYINTPEEMKTAFKIQDMRPEMDYFD